MSTSSPTNLPGYFQAYIDQVPETALTAAFANQSQVIRDWLPGIPEEKTTFAYAPGKWTIREVLQHLIDTERILTFRALSFARNEQAPLPGFDENNYAVQANGNTRSWEQLQAEFIAVRKASLFLFDSFTPEMLGRSGVANSNHFSVKQLGFIVVGHFYHHRRIIEERYLNGL